MADDLNWTTEDFQKDDMKPIAGEEPNVLWARHLAGDIGHVYYNQPPILSWDMAIETTETTTYRWVKRLHKSNYCGTFKIYYSEQMQDGADFDLQIDVDGTQGFLHTAITDLTSGVAYQEFGASGQDEWLTATISATLSVITNGEFSASIEIYPNWDAV